MCGIACYLGKNIDEGINFAKRAKSLLEHRGPDDFGIYTDEDVALLHRRLSIVDLSPSGHQPMESSCGRYVIVFNGEIYNHAQLRNKYLQGHSFRGHSDTETIVELFRLRQEKMLDEMVGMWAIAIWDKVMKRLFISRDRFGQKPVYIRRDKGAWLISSEMKPLIAENERSGYNATALTEYLALGNYGHLGINTFFDNIQQFPQGYYAWLSCDDTELITQKYWILPDVRDKDKIPFDNNVKKQLHDLIVEGVLSQTMSDVPIGITLSGGIDSSIVAGILATYYDKDIHVFTAQAKESKYDETKYVDAVIAKFKNNRFIVHRKNLNELSIKQDLLKYIKIQEEPFGDPSIIAHGFLMEMAAEAGIKVILNGQGADELFFGYNNMAQAILLREFKSMQFGKFYSNLKAMNLGSKYLLRTLLNSMLPGVEYNLRLKSRHKRREHIVDSIANAVDDNMVKLYRYDNIYNVWAESVYGVHIPHLVHYDDRNGMANSIEGRMPFLDHRIADFLAQIRPEEFLRNGLRKYMLRETCKQYLPDEIYNRTDKIGFYTPLIHALTNDEAWVTPLLQQSGFVKSEFADNLTNMLKAKKLDIPNALHIWRIISARLWMKEFNVGK